MFLGCLSSELKLYKYFYLFALTGDQTHHLTGKIVKEPFPTELPFSLVLTHTFCEIERDIKQFSLGNL